MKIEEKIIKNLIDSGKTLSVAESCTGGLISNRLTNISGSSDPFRAGIVAYSNDAKSLLLKVPSALIKKHGAVSEEVSLKMANGIRAIQNTDYAISVTGIAGPTGGTKAKPVGLVYISVATELESLCLKCQFEGTREQIKKQTANQALNLLYEFLK